MLVDESSHTLDQFWVVCGHMQTAPFLLCIGGEQPAGESIELLVDVRLLRQRDGRGFEVGALDQADGRPERDERFDILRSSMEIRLQRDANPRRSLARPPKQLDGGVDVWRALHVDPDEVVARGRVIDQPLKISKAEICVEIQAKL